MKTKSITKQQFLDDVSKELISIKANATKEEIGRLNLHTFNSEDKGGCIYGQMTKDCASHRAKVLMDNSCVRVMDIPSGCNSGVDVISRKTFNSVKSKINGEYKGQTWVGGKNWEGCLNRTYKHLSMVEAYICLKDAKIYHIIEFLQDETNTINLKL